MGDLNAVDVAGEVHAQILRSVGALSEANTLIYGNVLPAGPLYEGLYIDDHFVIRRLLKSEAHVVGGEDYEIIRVSHQAYRQASLERAPEKRFRICSPRDH